mmetsp:Transcript_588/g.1847  ORF Transcript_588/g.1847 Transcript_588/m.1847 type:complete len:379 (+) Transcript_588:55-1191(+)
MAELLVAQLHGKLLRRVCHEVHYQGLGVAARILCRQGKLPSALAKKLQVPDNAFAVLRHITLPSSEALYETVDTALCRTASITKDGARPPQQLPQPQCQHHSPHHLQCQRHSQQPPWQLPQPQCSTRSRPTAPAAGTGAVARAAKWPPRASGMPRYRGASSTSPSETLRTPCRGDAHATAIRFSATPTAHASAAVAAATVASAACAAAAVAATAGAGAAASAGPPTAGAAGAAATGSSHSSSYSSSHWLCSRELLRAATAADTGCAGRSLGRSVARGVDRCHIFRGEAMQHSCEQQFQAWTKQRQQQQSPAQRQQQQPPAQRQQQQAAAAARHPQLEQMRTKQQQQQQQQHQAIPCTAMAATSRHDAATAGATTRMMQ